jgi:gas vesicle protein
MIEMNNGNEDTPAAIANPLLCFLLGSVFGATLALMYAPASGADTRSGITRRANRLKDKAEEFKNRAVDKAAEWTGMAKSTAHDALDRVTAMVETANRSDILNESKSTTNV